MTLLPETTPTVDDIRKELRDAIFWTIFRSYGADFEPDEVAKKVGRVIPQIMTEFGTRSKLLTPAEGNDWLDVIYARNGATLADIGKKYGMGDKAPTEETTTHD